MKKLFWLTALCMLLTQVSTAQIYDIYSVIPTFNTVETDNYCSDSPIAVEVVMTAGAITDDDGFSIRMKSYPGGLSWAGYDGLCPDDYNCAYGFSIDPGDVPDGLYYFEASCKFFAHAGDPDYEQSEVFSLKTITCGNVEDPLNWTSAKVRDNTGMSMADGKIYYVDDNRKVRNFYWTGTNWISDVLNTTAPKAKDGVDIVATVENVYYVGDDNKIKNLYWTGTDWAYTSLVASQPEVRSNSNIAFGDGKIYFVSADNNKVYNLYKVGATWYCSALNNDAPDVRDDSKLATDVGKVYFVSSTPLNASTNKMIYNYYWDGDSWEYAMLNSSAPKAMDGAGPAVCNAKVYYTAEDQKVKRLKWNTATGVWDVNSLLATQKLVDAGEQIAVVDDIIFFHNSFDLVYYLKVSGHAWNEYSMSPCNAYSSTSYSDIRDNTTIIPEGTGKVYYVGTDRRLRNFYTVACRSSIEISPVPTEILTAFPNPSNGIIKLMNASTEPLSINTLRVVDLQGKMVYVDTESKLVNANASLDLDLSQIPNGVYFILSDAGDEIISNRIIISH